MPDYSALDAALNRLAPYAPDLANGFTNHAPMALEALSALGRADAVLPWLDRYQTDLLPRSDATLPIEEWRDALGAHNRVADWCAHFAAELQIRPWREVVVLWLPRLMPGISAAALHGVIRVGHAVRSLDERETPQRSNELGGALGYWAAHFTRLPTSDNHRRRLHPRDAILLVPHVPPERSTFRGSITSALAALEHIPEFAGVAGWLDCTDGAAPTLSAVSDTFARVYLANAHDGLSTIVFIHAVTGPVALRSLLPYMSEADGQTAVRYAWQASAALYSAFATAPILDAETPARASRGELVDLAVANGDEHAIKFVEANLREHAIHPQPVYLSAALHVLGML